MDVRLPQGEDAGHDSVFLEVPTGYKVLRYPSEHCQMQLDSCCNLLGFFSSTNHTLTSSKSRSDAVL